MPLSVLPFPETPSLPCRYSCSRFRRSRRCRCQYPERSQARGFRRQSGCPARRSIRLSRNLSPSVHPSRECCPSWSPPRGDRCEAEHLLDRSVKLGRGKELQACVRSDLGSGRRADTLHLQCDTGGIRYQCRATGGDCASSSDDESEESCRPRDSHPRTDPHFSCSPVMRFPYLLLRPSSRSSMSGYRE